MKRSCYVSKVEDKILVKVTKLNKNLNIIIDSREMKALIRNYLDTREVHVQIIFINEKVKIFNFSLKEFIFFEINIQLCIS